MRKKLVFLVTLVMLAGLLTITFATSMPTAQGFPFQTTQPTTVVPKVTTATGTSAPVNAGPNAGGSGGGASAPLATIATTAPIPTEEVNNLPIPATITPAGVGSPIQNIPGPGGGDGSFGPEIPSGMPNTGGGWSLDAAPFLIVALLAFGLAATIEVSYLRLKKGRRR